VWILIKKKKVLFITDTQSTQYATNDKFNVTENKHYVSHLKLNSMLVQIVQNYKPLKIALPCIFSKREDRTFQHSGDAEYKVHPTFYMSIYFTHWAMFQAANIKMQK
jgi:hypothetical protein